MAPATKGGNAGMVHEVYDSLFFLPLFPSPPKGDASKGRRGQNYALLPSLCHKFIQCREGSFCQFLIFFFFRHPFFQRRNKAEVDVHGLEIFALKVGNVVAEGTDGRFSGERCRRFSKETGGGAPGGHNAGRSLPHRSSDRQKRGLLFFLFP